MDEGESQNYLLGNANRRLLFSSQLSQGVENSQQTYPLPNENSIDRSLDVRLLSQMDFFTPAFNDDNSSQLFESVKDSTENSGIFGETPQKTAKTGSRNIFKRKTGFETPQVEGKKQCLFSSQAITVSTLPMPKENPYLILPPEIDESLQRLLQKPDFKVLDETRLTRYQRDFKELQVLGKGNFSTVTLCKHRVDGCYYAIKQISLTSQQKKSLERKAKKEVHLLSALNSAPNIIHYFNSWEEDDYFFIQLEYAYYGNVARYRERYEFKENDVGSMLWQISNALHWLHSHGIAHMDVKPENIVILKTGKSEWSFKLNDFGLATAVETESIDEGDARYLPPEIITTSTAFKADVFALGVTAIELLTPLHLVKEKNFYTNLRTGKIPSSSSISPFIRPLIEGMINVSIDQRLSMDQIVNHMYFNAFKK